MKQQLLALTACIMAIALVFCGCSDSNKVKATEKTKTQQPATQNNSQSSDVIFNTDSESGGKDSGNTTSTKTKIGYSVVSVTVNKSYDFKEDFSDSVIYDDDFRTEGIFKMSDPDPDITLTLKDNSTGETFVFEKNKDTEWYLTSTIDHLLYEDAQAKATLEIVTLGGKYGVKNKKVSTTIKVKSSLYSADFHKYPTYDYPYTVMYEGTNYTVLETDTAKKTAKLKILKIPHTFELWLFNVETRQTDTFEPKDYNFTFADEITVTEYNPDAATFWIHIPSQLEMKDGYVLKFTLSVDAHKNK